MQSIEEVVAPLLEKSIDELRAIAPAVGLDADAIFRIVQGHTRRPSFEHVRRIANWVEAQSKIKPKRRLAK